MEELSNQEDNFDDLPALDDAPLDFGDDQMNLDDIDLESGVMDSDSLPELDLEGSTDFDTDDADTAMDFSVDDVGSPADIADDFQVFDDDGDEPDMFADDSVDMTATDDQSAFLDDETFADDFESVSDSDADAGLDLEMDGSFDELSSEVSADSVEADATVEAGDGGFQPDIFDEDEDDSIALSPDELDNILSNSDDDLFEDMSGEDATEAPSDSEGYDAVAPIDDSELSAPSDESDLVPTVDLEPIAPSDDTESVDSDMGFDDFADSDLSDVGAEPAYDDDSMDTDGFADLPPGLDGDDDEPIALSADELDNIMGDVEGGDAFGTDTTATDESLSTDLDEEPLPDLELDDIPDTSFDGMGVDGLDQEMDEPVIDAAPDMDSDEDDNITLTDDELSKVLLDTDESTEADASAAEDWSGTEEEIPDSPPLSSLEMDDDEPIALTPEELGNIVSEVDVEEPGAADEEPVSALDEFEAVEEFNTPDDFDAPVESAAESQEYETAEEYETAAFSGEGWDDDDDQVALSDDELGSILEDVDQGPEGASPEFSPGAEVSEGFDETFDTALSEEADAGSADDNQTDIINLDEYEEEAIGYQNESDAATAEATEVEQTERSAAVDKIASEEGLDRTELKKMIGYLDQLFDQLPENTIREFSRSEYFDLYKKIMTDLGM